MGATATIVGIGLLGAGAGAGLSSIMSKGAPKPSAPMPLPKPPKPEVAQTKAEDIIRKKRATASQTVYTSPLGVGGQADIAKKTLLGQ